jgi:hypothetical protein
MAKTERIITETNALTGETIVRPFNDEENAQADLDEARFKAEQKAKADELKVNADAKAELLNRLGITADEAKLLLS